MDDKLITISGVRGFIDENGVAKLNLEDIARGLGSPQAASVSSNIVVRWERARTYLEDIGAVPKVGHENNDSQLDLPEFIPENIFYRLAMRANSAAAIAFQETIANDILPAIRRHGMYLTPGVAKEAVEDQEVFLAKAVLLAKETIDKLRTKNAQIAAVVEIQAEAIETQTAVVEAPAEELEAACPAVFTEDSILAVAE